MKKVYIVHRWDATPESDWYPWLKRELEKREFVVKILKMPDPGFPKISTWLGYLMEKIKEPNKVTYFIGHSVGCQAILRFIERLPVDAKVGGVILVAPWLELTNIKEEGEEVVNIAKPWLKTRINFDRIKRHCDNFTCVFSDDDFYVPLSNVDKFYNQLGNKTLILKRKGHFTKEEGVEKIPEILEFL